MGLRCFKAVGGRQDSVGVFAGVIPNWMDNLLRGKPHRIYAGGETSRESYYVDDVVEANLLAATAAGETVTGKVYNVVAGRRSTLNELYTHPQEVLAPFHPVVSDFIPENGSFPSGDVRHSRADISKAIN